MSIEVRNIVKTFGEVTALKDVSFEVKSGELVAMLGPSGSGKTTLLRVISGLEKSDSGSVHFHGDDMTRLRITDRRVGFVFQHYALFRHMNVFENVAFGLNVRAKEMKLTKKDVIDRVLELLRLVRLESMSLRYPSQLSGGQRQRVALARALAIEPKVLLLDEPFGALDARVRKELRQWLRRLHDKLHMTSLFVTHDQEEALEVADRIIVMNEGRIEQIGTPDEVYHHPSNPFVSHFLGDINLFHCRLEDGKAYLGNMPIDFTGTINPDAKKGTIYVRPHLLDIDRSPNGNNAFQAKIRHINMAGARVRIELVTPWGDPVQVEMSHDRYRLLNLTKGEEVFVNSKELKVFESDFGDYSI